jgi:3-phenylpropionate/cinnamic acid dioxygenase small subunit
VLGPLEEVRNLLGRYCDLVDAADWAGVGELFAGGRLTAGGAVLAAGAEEIRRFFERGTRLHDGSPRTKHLVANTQLAVDGGVVVARSSYLVLQAAEGDPPVPIVTGRYVDTFEVDASGAVAWRERAFDVDLTGDLSRHLTWTPPPVPGPAVSG